MPSTAWSPSPGPANENRLPTNAPVARGANVPPTATTSLPLSTAVERGPGGEGVRRIISRLIPSGLALLVFAAAVACEGPDASHVTSPSAKTLVGTTTGNVAYEPPEKAPADVPDPKGWDVSLDNARFAKLEDGTRSIQIVMQVDSEAGPGMELWLTDRDRTVVRWSGGSTRPYNGVVCFQLQIEDDAAGLALGDGPHALTVTFRDPGTGEPVVSRTIRVAGTVPTLRGGTPGTQSEIARELLGCPRSVI